MDVFGQIDVLMDDGFNPILLVGNSTISWQAIHGIFIGSKESLFRVYFRSGLVLLNEYRFKPHEVQSWLGLINHIRFVWIWFSNFIRI
jgi:hypothetical protein